MATSRSFALSVSLSALLAAFCSSPPAEGETFNLELKRIERWNRNDEESQKDPFFLYRETGGQSFSRDEGTPEAKKDDGFVTTIHKEPSEYKCERPFRGVARLGEDLYGFTLDSTDLFNNGYHLLHFDFNRNGDLTDDEVVEAVVQDEDRRRIVQTSEKQDWGPEQLTGAPDTPEAGDRKTAWASLTEDDQEEWLVLYYHGPVDVRSVKVHETYNPGAVSKVCVFDSEGVEQIVWSGTDPTSPDGEMGVSEIPIETGCRIDRIKIYLDSVNTAGWNEIDAVGLVDASGETHWAIRAEASSCYTSGFFEFFRSNESSHVNREFPRLDVKVTSGSDEIDYAFFFQVYSSIYRGEERNSYAYASLISAVYREGEATLDGVRRKIVLLDYDSNARFGDPFEVIKLDMDSENQVWPKGGDMVVLDPDLSNREMWWGVHGRKERHYLSKMLRIGDRFYNLSVSPSGATMTLEASTLPLGFVQNPNLYSAVVYGEFGLLKIEGATSEAVPLPAGDWRLLSCQIDGATSAKRETPVLPGPITMNPRTFVQASGAAKSPTTTVVAGKTVHIPFGPPYRALVTVGDRRYPRTDGKVELAMILVGSASEVCTSAYVDGAMPPQPTFSIAAPDGKIVQRGSFEYG